MKVSSPARLIKPAVHLLAVVTVATVVGFQVTASAASTTSATVDLSKVVQRTDPFSIGVGSSTYGANPLSSPAQAAAEETLDARYIRLPLGFRNNRVTTSAAGGNTELDGVALTNWYRSKGFQVIAVLGGRTNDVDIQPGDATKIISALGFDNIVYSTPNEPGNQGWDIEQQISAANMILAEGKALRPDFKLWGPTWAYYEPNLLKTFASRLGVNNLDGLDYHHYAMGSTSLSTSTAMAETPTYGAEIRQTRQDLRSLGLPENVSVDELNFSWRYEDGTPGGNQRFFTAINTVWVASALGHIASNGGRGAVYATQNGPLGVTVEGGNLDQGRPASSPMPAYWGIGAWTGAKIFPHYKDAFYEVSGSTDPSVETFAVNNEAGGYNLVLINKQETSSTLHQVNLRGITSGTYTAYQTNPATPYDAPRSITTNTAFNNTISVELPAMSVTTVVMVPAVSAPVTAVTTTTTTTPAIESQGYQLNIGGGSVPGWSTGDELVSGGNNASNGFRTVPPVGIPAAIFDTERYGAQTWQLPVSGSGEYELKLFFAERFRPAQKVGKRQFRVVVNGTVLASAYEPWVAQGKTSTGSSTLSSRVTAINGKVTIQLLKGSRGEPMINGLQLVAVSAPPTTIPSTTTTTAVLPQTPPPGTRQCDDSGQVWYDTNGNGLVDDMECRFP